LSTTGFPSTDQRRPPLTTKSTSLLPHSPHRSRAVHFEQQQLGAVPL